MDVEERGYLPLIYSRAQQDGYQWYQLSVELRPSSCRCRPRGPISKTPFLTGSCNAYLDEVSHDKT